MLADICANVVRTRPITTGYSLYLDAGNASSNSGSGATWSDLSGNGYDMTWTGGYGRGGSGATAYFTTDGINGTHAKRTSTSFYGAAQTWSGWFYATRDATQFPMSEELGGNYFLGLLWTAGGNISFIGYDSVSYRFQTPTTGGATGLSQSTWYHFAGVYDGSNAYVYVNGTQAATVAQTGSITAQTTTYKIGTYSETNTSVWQGRIAQVVLYSTALSAAQVLTNFNADKARYGY